MSYGTYYVDDYTGTDYAKITAAINAANTAGGGKVVLSNRKYTIYQSIVLYDNIHFCGAGASSIIECNSNLPIIQINRNSSKYFQISDMQLMYSTSMNSTTHFHVEADRPLYLKIIGVFFIAEGRTHSGVLTWDALSGSKTQRILIDDEHADPAFMTHIENCLFSGASIWLNDSDSRIINNYIWANGESSPNFLQYAIRLSNGSVNVSGNDIVPGNDCGIYLDSTCSGIRVENNYFDGSWGNVLTGWGIYDCNAKRNLIVGNTFVNIYSGGIYVASAEQITISNNIFMNLNRSGDSASQFDIKILGGNVPSIGHIITGNQHYRDSLVNGQNYAVFVDNSVQATMVNNSLIDNVKDVGAYHKPPFVMSTNKYAIRKDNRVTYYVTHPQYSTQEIKTYLYQFDEGEVVVQHSSSAQTATVNFAPDFSAQGIIPRVQDIHINFVGGSSNSSVVYSIWGLSATGFFISFRPVDSSSVSNGIFYWRVSLQ